MSLQDLLVEIPREKHRLLVTQLVHFLDAEESLLSFAFTDRSAQKEEAMAIVRKIVLELEIISAGVLDGDALYDISEDSAMWYCELNNWLDRHASDTDTQGNEL